MKKFFLLITLIFFTFKAFSQGPTEQSRVITTGVPFLLISADPRSASMGDVGVATSADAFSQQWNPAKYAFSISKQGVGVTYTPYLSNLVNDIFLGNLVYYNRINERSAIAGSIRYFSLGEIEARETPQQIQPLILSPNEFTIDLSYALRLSDRFSMAVAGRYLRSDLKLQVASEDASAAASFGVDIAGYYQSEEIAYNDFDGRWRLGFNISNLGPKIKYDDIGQENSLPTNLGIGGGFDFILDEYNKIGLTAEANKLLVPTPSDSNNDGVINREDDYYNESFFSGVFSSFGDAPDGFSEEIKEVTWALGAEYTYQDVFALRTGYFNESDEKGTRKFFGLGAGFKYTAITIDLSYLFSTSRVISPLEGTLRFGLTFSFGDEYDEY
ncbi:type IX secretion system outer membrane channel protein PorV [Altibacter sp. HG106]|uniref:type IX secretion system outer membrane channel protein PorV n=1 Tax=Altibacter sp. HG106 TaxID=3023937 RepID=UPI0023508647|nr:type IX secretion system outer membrane channel protein PorV [Altibacter sp. HG106]MDC7995946.1 type IX secretion system outer membrane channel protein PorV [Altibacter sp. HG106]